jgi:hypothetical protein
MIKRRSLLTLILLSFITCGIYGIVFWYNYSDDMNKVCNGDGKQTQNYLIVFLLSFITCGIYPIVWLSRGKSLARGTSRTVQILQSFG